MSNPKKEILKEEEEEGLLVAWGRIISNGWMMGFFFRGLFLRSEVRGERGRFGRLSK